MVEVPKPVPVPKMDERSVKSKNDDRLIIKIS